MPDRAAAAAFAASPTAVALRGAVQHYDWGGFTFIPDLLGVENPRREPFAELWIGAHPGAPSTAELAEATVPLNMLVEEGPEALLGAGVAAQFAGRLPYLLKVLDARKMLSIQAHPTKTQAEEGFAFENAEGIPVGAPHRNYKDDNHKPEVHVALTDFWMLHGFRSLEDIADVLAAVPELTGLMPDYARLLDTLGEDSEARASLLRGLYSIVMSMPQAQVDATLEPLIARLRAEPPTDKDSPDFWALRAADDFPLPDGHRDRGIFSVYLLNLVHLRPGQGTYQPAGMLHAYLEGTNVELMANSDNVLRGGLTPKHVDVPELMSTLVFSGGRPEILNGERQGDGITVYPTPAAEFELSRIELGPEAFQAFAAGHGPDALIVMAGAAVLSAEDTTLRLPRGGIAFVPDAVGYALSGEATIYRATTPASR